MNSQNHLSAPRSPQGSDVRHRAVFCKRRKPRRVGLFLFVAMCVGCTTEEDTIKRLEGKAEPYRADTYLLRATFSAAKDDTLKSVADLDRIVALDLSGSFISDDGLTYLIGMPNLWELNVTNTRITDAGMKHLTEIGRGKDGHPLDLTLDRTAVSDEGIRFLAPMGNLASLSLKGTRITDSSLRSLQVTKSLGGLGLDKTRITDDGLAPLAGLELSWLSLRDTRVSDKGLRYLHPIKTLQQIDVTGTRVTREGIKALEEAIPHIQVENGCHTFGQ